MKISNIIRSSAVGLAAVVLATGCSDSFLESKQDYSKVTSEIWKDYAGCKARIDNIYTVMQPRQSGSNFAYYPSSGESDIFSQSTEEYSGLGNFVNPEKILDYTTVEDFFYYSRKTSEGMYGRIRNCNDAIIGINGSDGITDDQREELLGQAYFFRAWMYYRLVKVYGGVPIITEVLDPIGTNTDIDLTRSSTKVCIDFIAEDLELAAKYLPSSWGSGDYGRVTSGAALALLGRLQLLYASPIFNRADDGSRWEKAFTINERAINELKAGGFGLAYLEDPGMNGSGWAKMFSDYTSPEAVFVTLYNNVKKPDDNTDPVRNNGWENGIRPANAGGGGKTPSAMLMDIFPMADGGKSTYCAQNGFYSKLQNSGYIYNAQLPFLNRDPRFYRTYAFPGVMWQFKGDLSDRSKFSADKYPYSNGELYQLWNYAWYTDVAEKDDDSKSGYGADKLATDYKGFYIRKKTDDYQVNTSPLYGEFDDIYFFRRSATPYMEMRYAEVLLNYAEAACGAQKYDIAIQALIDIRKRVGYTEDNNYYGLGDLKGTTDRAKIFSAILYERQIELAYEGKRFDDMRRWMLFDGGVNQSDLKSTWALAGFGGNTCTYLGVTPMNGLRRDNLELRISDAINNGLGTSTTKDPLEGVATRPAPLDLSTKLLNDDGTPATQTSELVDFYTNYLVRKARRGDKIGMTVKFEPEYYFIGLKENAQKTNAGIEQTIGWGTYGSGGSMGTFDPLAE